MVLSSTNIITGGVATDAPRLSSGRALQVGGSQLEIDLMTGDDVYTYFGLVVTEVDPSSTFTIEGFDMQGQSLGMSEAYVFKNSFDEFLGISNMRGLGSVKITTSDINGWHADHIQYGL